jgi:hypothetical protein
VCVCVCVCVFVMLCARPAMRCMLCGPFLLAVYMCVCVCGAFFLLFAGFLCVELFSFVLLGSHRVVLPRDS